jgi:hypothetical protein
MRAIGVGINAALVAFGADERTGASRLLVTAGGGAAGSKQRRGANEQSEQFDGFHIIGFVFGLNY